MQCKISENKSFKFLSSSVYNYKFDKSNGFFMRWGKDINDDPAFSPFGPEILDIEVTTICHGVTNSKTGIKTPCAFCYKSNTSNGVNMSFEDFKKVFDKMPRTLTQVAFGADSHATSNPDLFKMMDYCRNNGKNFVVPNITVAEISDETADKLANVCGAVAVSRYSDKNICYDSIKKLTDRGMKQCNIHFMIAESTYDAALETLNDRLTDPRLAKLNAIVFLSLKQKGRGKNFISLSNEKFKNLVDFAIKNNIAIGFDSCSAFKFLEAVKDNKNYEMYKMYCDPCESTLFSLYIDVEGKGYPCSFAEGTESWEDGINVKNCNDFIKDVWYNDKINAFRKNLLDTASKNCHNCRECPLFKI